MAHNQITSPRLSLARRTVGFYSHRLRHQIVVPYLMLATVLAAVGTYIFVSTANQSLQDRFNKQLLDSVRDGADSFAQAEIKQIAGLRAMIYTEGVPGAIVGRNTKLISDLVVPQALNYSFDRVLVVATDSTILLNLPQALVTADGNDELKALITAALQPSGGLDKLSAVIQLPDGAVLYTAAPVRDGGAIVGVVLAGNNLPQVLRDVTRDSLSNGATFYGQGGAPVASNVTAAAGSSPLVEALPGGWYEAISSNPRAPARFRTVKLAGESYIEVFGVVPGRGPGDVPPGVYGVMLSTSMLNAEMQQSLWVLIPIFGIGLIMIVMVGNIIAARIDRPVAQLVAASAQVAQGNLDVQVHTGRSDELGLLAVRFNEMVEGLRQLLLVEDLFGRFVSPEVSAKLLAGQIELGGEQREVTALFCDLRDFTHMTEEQPAQVVVDTLNEYLRTIMRAAKQHGGIVNKFGGDSTLIIFGAPVDMPDHADRALAAALDMRSALASLNERRIDEGWEPLRQGTGISTGTVVAGQVGSEERMEYTIIGDAVNVAARLEAMTKKLTGCDIIFSESTLEALKNRDVWNFNDQGHVELRGKQRQVKIYNLVGRSDGDEQLDGKVSEVLGWVLEEKPVSVVKGAR